MFQARPVSVHVDPLDNSSGQGPASFVDFLMGTHSFRIALLVKKITHPGR